MVVLAFLVPMFVLVSDLARDSAISTAERDAELLARVLSVLTVEQDVESAVSTVGEERISDVNGSIIVPTGQVFGLPTPEAEEEDLSLAAAGSSFVAAVEDGAAVYVPVLTPDGSTSVVRVFVSDESMRAGVTKSWLILGLLGIALVAIAAWVADRLGRSLVEPVRELSQTATLLSEGDLSARVQPTGPAEIQEVGLELNRLASQIGRLLQDERETAADLAHRLRTPLTASRLTIDGLEPGPTKDRLLDDLNELQRTTDFIITEARRPVRSNEDEQCDLASIVDARAAFWESLAVEQNRWITVEVTKSPTLVNISNSDAETLIDALIENVVSHTEPGTAFRISIAVEAKTALLTVEDAGDGFADNFQLARGSSGGSSTGLGLDIVRRIVEASDGTVTIGSSPSLGGAAITVHLPIVPPN
jgi:signal transduction histidine kinase